MKYILFFVTPTMKNALKMIYFKCIPSVLRNTMMQCNVCQLIEDSTKERSFIQTIRSIYVKIVKKANCIPRVLV
jgi:hypothetical protein